MTKHEPKGVPQCQHVRLLLRLCRIVVDDIGLHVLTLDQKVAISMSIPISISMSVYLYSYLYQLYLYL